MKPLNVDPPALDSMAPTIPIHVSAKPLNWRGRISQAFVRSGRSSESGVTLLECLVGIAVIAVTATLILPPLFIASASRVQNRRAEQAFQIAQDEIDRIQTLVASGQHDPLTNLPASAGAFTNGANVAPPTGVAGVRKCVNTTLANQYTGSGVGALQAIPIDIDGITTNGNPCEPEFYMQVFRSANPNDTAPGNSRPTSFILGVRVYSALARDNFNSMTAPVQPAALNITSGTGSQRVRPLVALYPRLTWSDQGTTLCQLHQQGGTPCP